MNKIPAQLTGIFARSKNLIRTSRDFDRRRCTKLELEQIRKEDVKKIIAMQQDFEYITDGNLLWQDLFRQLTKTSGIKLGPLTRFFETNTFYRRPIIIGDIKFESNQIENFYYFDLLPTIRKAILPGPVTFCGMSENQYYKTDFLTAVANILSRIVKFLVQKGVKVIQFSEPFLTYHGRNMKSKDFKLAKEAYRIIADNRNDSQISLHTYFGDFTAISSILKFPVDSLTIDLTYTNLKKLNFVTNKKIGLGCIDATNSLLENTKETIKLAGSLIKRLKLKNFFICPNCDFDFLPYPVAEKKIEILRKVASEFIN